MRADARCCKRYAACNAALREGDAQLRACGECGRDAGYHLAGDIGFSQRVDFFLRTAEDHRVAAFQSHHITIVARGFDQLLVDETLIRRDLSRAFADGNFLGFRRERNRIRMHQRVVENNVGVGENPRRAQREQIGRAGACADECDFRTVGKLRALRSFPLQGRIG